MISEKKVASDGGSAVFLCYFVVEFTDGTLNNEILILTFVYSLNEFGVTVAT